MSKRHSPLDYRQHGRKPVEFPAARFSTFSIRWALVEEETNFVPRPVGTPFPNPLPPPSMIFWDWWLINVAFAASMDWGLITSPFVATNLDFGFLPAV
jgi:hypothetical protein